MAMQIKRRGVSVKMPRSVMWTIATVVVLLVLMVGGGIAYIWYIGQDDSDVVAKELPITSQKEKDLLSQPSEPSPTSRVGVSVQTSTAQVLPGTNASITIRTLPTALCSISVMYNNVASKDSGLVPHTADIYGTTSWTWTVDQNAPLGKWPITVTCEFNKKSAMVKADIEVVAKLSEGQ